MIGWGARLAEWRQRLGWPPEALVLHATLLAAGLALLQTFAGLLMPGSTEEPAPPLPVEASASALETMALAVDPLNGIEPSAGAEPGDGDGDGAGNGAGDQPMADPARGLLDPQGTQLRYDSIEGLEDVARNLQERSKTIEQQETEQAIKERELELRQQEVDAQLERVQAYHAKIEALLQEIRDDDEGRIAQLVKVYETMKPKQAAIIFDRLDPEVLLKVAVRMREPKLSSVLAKMEPGRARFLTFELARKVEVPSADASPQ